MKNQRSSIVQHNKTSHSSLLQQRESLPPISTLPIIKDQKELSATSFFQTCPYRIENIDRHAIIKRQDMEACLKRLSERDDVYGVIIATMNGQILSECESLKNWIPSLASLCSFARYLIRNNDPNDHIQAVRLKTKVYELIITIHHEQLLIVMKMLVINNKNQTSVENNNKEEDWEAFIKRIQQQNKSENN